MRRVILKDKKGLQQLIRDCEILGLTEHESLEYIKNRYGKRISRSNYYKMKSSLKKNDKEIFRNRLDDHTRIKFVKEHFTRIDELTSLQRMLLNSVYEETLKPVGERNLIGISKIAANINAIATTLTVLNIGSPLFEFLLERKVTEVKKSIINYDSIPKDHNLVSIQTANNNNNNNDNNNNNKIKYPPSFLFLPNTNTYEEQLIIYSN